MSLYNANGQISTTVVDGSSYTGPYAADGSWNIYLTDGSDYVGLYSACGAYNAFVVTDISSPYLSPNGALSVLSSNGNYTPVVPLGVFVATTGTSIDAIAPVAAAVNAQSISTDFTVGVNATAMLVSAHFNYSQHSDFSVTWTVGDTVQTFQTTDNFNFILTSDNGTNAPAIALIGLLNPTPGAGTLTVSFSSAADNLVLEAATFSNVNLNGGLSGAFTAAKFTTGTSNSTSLSLPAISGGIQCAFAGGVAGTPTTWSSGTEMYNTSSGGDTWGSGVYQAATDTTVYSLGISASELWSTAGVVVNPSVSFSANPSLDVSNPLTDDLTFCIPCLAAGTLTDLVTNKTASTVSCTTDTSGGYGGGIAVPANSTTAGADFGAWQPIQQGDFTIVVLANPSTSNSARQALIGQCDSTPSGFIDFISNSVYTNSNVSGNMAGGVFGSDGSEGADDGGREVTAGTMHVGLIDGGYHCWGLRVASGVPSLWCDGANTTENLGNVTGTYVNTNQHFAIGNLGNYTAAAFSAGCTIVLAEGFSVALTDDQMASITANPFQVLK